MLKERLKQDKPEDRLEKEIFLLSAELVLKDRIEKAPSETIKEQIKEIYKFLKETLNEIT